MTARLLFVTTAALSLASAAVAADPAKPELRNLNVPATPHDLVLASVDTKAPGSETAVQAPSPKHRTARVTTCRCGGDPQPQDESSESE